MTTFLMTLPEGCTVGDVSLFMPEHKRAFTRVDYTEPQTQTQWTDIFGHMGHDRTATRGECSQEKPKPRCFSLPS